MSILILAEHHGGKLAATFPKLVGAAHKLGKATVVVLGDNVKAVAAEAAAFAGVEKVITIEHADLARPTAEAIVENLASLAQNAQAVLAASSTYSRGALARLAARLGRPMLSDLMGIHSATQYTRPIYAGAVQAKVETPAGPVVATVRVSSFEAAAVAAPVAIEAGTYTPAKVKNTSVALEATGSNRPELTSARLVVSGGRGLGSKENFAMIEKLADRMGAAVGASRAAVDAGYAPNDYQVGQTGKVVAPDLYIAVGISGAVQHLAGIKGAKTIVVINKDPNAPIFKWADYGLVADLFQVVPELTDKVK